MSSYRCVCGSVCGGRRLFSLHQRECAVFWDAVRAEMGRLADERGTPGYVPSKVWARQRCRTLPSEISLIKLGGQDSWNGLMKQLGMATVRSGRDQIAPPMPDHWPSLLEPGRHISRYAPVENMRALCKIVMVGTVYGLRPAR